MPDSVTLKQDLPQWLKSLELRQDVELHKRRLAGVEGLIKQMKPADVEAIVRLALKTRHLPAKEAIARARQPFQAADESFSASANDRELQLLCGATLAELFRRQGDIPAIAALATNTATSLGFRSELPFDVAEASEIGIQRQAELHRRRPDLRPTPLEFPKAEFEKAVQAFQAQPDLNNVVTALNLMIEGSKHAFGMISKRSWESLASVSAFVSVQDEELDMLWWAIGERSADFDRPFSKMSREERPAIVAKELAAMTLYAPGPPAVKALLARTGLKESDKLTVPSCVNACESKWLRGIVDGAEPSPVTRPIHFAAARKLETADDSSWIPGWSAATGIGADSKFSALHLGLQFYRERVLTRWAPS